MLTVRSGLPDDIPNVIELWNRAAGPTRQAGQHHEAEQLLRHDPDALIVAEDDGQLLGTLIAGWDGWRCHLYRLAVEPVARRSGVARALVSEAQTRASARGARRLDAMVDPANVVALTFWDAIGFECDTDQRWSLLL